MNSRPYLGVGILTTLFILVSIINCSEDKAKPEASVNCEFKSNQESSDDCLWEIVIDNRFSSEQKHDIVLALYDWKIRIPEMNFHIRYDYLEEKYPFENKLIHIHQNYSSDMDKSKGDAWSFWGNGGGEIYFNIDNGIYKGDYSDIMVEVITEHEIGHVLGLGHTDPSKTPFDVMNPTVVPQCTISDADVGMVLAKHDDCQRSSNDP